MSLRQKLESWTRTFVGLPVALLMAALGALVWLASGPLESVAMRLVIAAGTLAVGAGMVWGMVRMARRAARRAIMAPLGDAIIAGDWALKHALGKSPIEDIDREAPVLLGESNRNIQGVVWSLEEWLRVAQHADAESAALAGTGMQRDLELAREFQLAYLNRPYPKVPEVHIEGRLRLEFYHRYQPALALGGDFFDIVELGPDCVGVFIADVMGHGTRSALITSILRTLIGDLQSQARNAPHFLNELNKQFCEVLRTVPSPLFASAHYFVPDVTARVATFSSAGHPAPFLVRTHISRITRLEVPPPKASALGLIPTETFTGGHVRLLPGDMYLLFTDGVYEAHSPSGEEFGVTRMEAVLHRLVYKPMREMVDGIMDAVIEWVGDQPLADDICMVAVRVTDKASTDTHG